MKTPLVNRNQSGKVVRTLTNSYLTIGQSYVHSIINLCTPAKYRGEILEDNMHMTAVFRWAISRRKVFITGSTRKETILQLRGKGYLRKRLPRDILPTFHDLYNHRKLVTGCFLIVTLSVFTYNHTISSHRVDLCRFKSLQTSWILGVFNSKKHRSAGGIWKRSYWAMK